MWVLIYFAKEKKSSVVKETLILPKPNGKKPDPGDEVFVRWNSSKHRAKLLRYSSTKAYLEKLNVDVKTGEIVMPQFKSAKGKEQNTVERQHILKTKRESNQSKAYTKKKHDELLLEKMDGLLQASGGEEALDETHQSSNFTQTQKEETNAQVEKENVTKRRRIGDDLKTKDPDPEGIKKEQFCSLDEVFSHLTVTSEIVTAFEYVTNYLRAHLQAQMVPLNPQVSSHNTGTKDIPIPAWQLPGIEKVQLGSSGVWVDSGQLKILTTSWRKNPNELARRLFKWLVGEPTLARTSALGGGAKQKQALDPFLRTAVAAYVEDVTGRRIEVNRIVNLMCGKLAVKYHVASTQSGERKSAPNPRDSAKTLGKIPREIVAHEKKTKIETPINFEVEISDPESFINKSSVSSKSGDLSVGLVGYSREKGIKKTSTPTKTKSKKLRKNVSSEILERRSSSSFDKSIDGMSPIKLQKNPGNNKTALTKSGERRRPAPIHQEKPATPNPRGSAKILEKNPRETVAHGKKTKIEPSINSEVENSDPESFINKSSVSSKSGDFSVGLVGYSREKEIKKTSTPTKTKSKKLCQNVSSQILGRRSSSSFDKSADGMSRIKSKKNESPENNKAEINTKDAGVTNEPPILTDHSQAGPNKENLTGLTHPPPAVTPQLYVPEMQQQWGYSHFGYQQTYPPPSPQYANYFNQTGNMHFPTNAPHHQMNYFGSFDQPSDNCEPASPNFYNL